MNPDYEEARKATQAKVAWMLDYRRKNKLEFFTPNPKQSELLEGWLNPYYKVFTYTGGNRSGKTTIGIIIAFSTLIGELPWNHEKLHFPHNKPRKVRYIGQDWEKHIGTVVIPGFREWWPNMRKVTKKKNTQSIEALWTDEKTGGTAEIMCLRPDQRVIMANGYEKQIDEISIGDNVLCSNGVTKVKDIYESECDVFYKIRTKNGREIVCSGGHRLKTEQGYVTAENLTCKYILDIEPIPYTPGKQTIEDWKLALTGLLIGDGKISGYCCEWSCFSDELLKWARSIIPSNLKIAEIPQRGKGAYRITQTKKRNYNPLIKWLKDCGLWGTNAYNKFIPELIFEQTPEKIGLFLSGLFSTDGTFGGHQITYSSRSFRLVDDLKRLLRRIDINASTGSYFRECEFDGYDCSGYVHVCRIGGRDNIRQFCKYIQFIGKSMDWFGFSTENINKKPHPRKERIVSIVLLEGGRCIDLEVEDSGHDYFVDGILTHNSNKQESDLHEGWEGDVIIYDEPPRRDIRIANARGLVDRQGRELFCMTLLKEAWVDREVIKARLEDGSPDTTVFNVHTEIYDNLGFGITKEGIDQYAKTLTDDEKQARLLGLPSYMSGLVYPTFSRKLHLRKRFKIPLDWMVDIAIDIHPRERQAVLFIATDRQDRKWVCDEIWEHGDGIYVGEEIIRFIQRNAYRVNRIICDPLAKGDKNEPNTTFDKIDRVLNRHGYVLDVGSKDKVAGILTTKNHLIGPNNEPSIFFFNDLIRTIYEIEGYIYDEDTQKPCVVGDTLVDTPTGQHPIKDLVGKRLYVYSYSNRHRRLNVSKAKNIRLTRQKAEIWKLTMDRGVLFATPEHQIMLRNGTYRQLKHLKPYDSLMPLYRTISVDGYARINPNDYRSKRGGKYPGEHRFVYECIYGMPPDNMEVHHIDGNYLNHNPQNLQLVDSSEHQRIHIAKGLADVKCQNCGYIFRQSRPWQKYCSKKCRQQYADKRRSLPKIYNKTCKYCGKQFTTKNHRYAYCSVICRQNWFRDNRQLWSAHNHKVLSVQFYGYEDVYDMEVENDHNFVANGIVVHNCDKDDHMMENLYRMLLLDTRYSEMEEEDEGYEQKTHSTWTGY